MKREKTKQKPPRDRVLDFVICQSAISFVAVVLILVTKFVGAQMYQKTYEFFDMNFNQDTNASQVLNPEQTTAVLNAFNPPKSSLNDESQDEISIESLSAENLENLNSICIPVVGRVTSEYSWRTHPISGEYLFHSGVDIAGNMGDDIKSALDGKVIEIDTVGTATNYGKYIKVEHESGVVTLYGHCSKILKEVGDEVKKGETIALVGSTGRSTGPHLHFEVRVNGQKLDPCLVADFV